MKTLHEKQQALFRDPAQIIGLWNKSGIEPELLECQEDKGWKNTLRRLGVTLLVTREYEHLLMALAPGKTTWMPVPHPSGLAADRLKGVVHIASTRNPNLLMELKGKTLLPRRLRFLPGRTYLHDLALIGGKLYGNSVGQNAIVELDYDKGARRVWWPRCIERGKPVFDRNHIQLNSIAAGRTLKDSYFSASGERILDKVPGDPRYPVDKLGVLFSGRTRQAMAWGLTRPHSARLRGKELWVDNSGYGEVGRIVEGAFHPVARLGGWTRGLCFVKGVLFVGVSKVLPRFHAYAPGLDHRKSWCGVAALDPRDGRVLGKIRWPYGNQIFAIDWMEDVRLPFGGGDDLPKLFNQGHGL